jgi:Uma2 family endonuclease
MKSKVAATIEDLYSLPDDVKAELVDGELRLMSPTGFLPNNAAGAIYASLREYARRTSSGHALTDNAGFIVRLPNRKLFSPDAAFYTGKATGMRFLEGPPIFAVEVRSEGDYDTQAESEIARKRADYFTAGTLVVWDVDLLANDVIKSYKATDPNQPIIYRRGQIADAEPAVPGWQIAVDELFV